MKKIMKRLAVGALAATIYMGNITAPCFAEINAEDKADKQGVFSAVGNWFSDRGNDLQNVGSAVGGWVGDRASDVQDMAVVAVDTTGKWFVDRGEDICEVSAVVGSWATDRAYDVQILVTDAGELIVCAARNFDPSKLATKEYYLDSGEKLLLGDYSDKDPTALSIGLNLAASVFNVDLGMDIRDLVYDVQNIGSEEVQLSGMAIDAVAILPVIGVLKYADTVADGVKVAGGLTDAASDVTKAADVVIDTADNVHDIAKAADLADVMTDTTKTANQIDNAADVIKATDQVNDTADAVKATDTINDAANTGKDIWKISLEELPEKVQETYQTYSEVGWDGEKALENMAEGTSAGRKFENYEELLPTVDEAGNELTYTEYDAFSFGDDPLSPTSRGSCRFVRDNQGNVYYTKIHYKTFRLISQL